MASRMVEAMKSPANCAASAITKRPAPASGGLVPATTKTVAGPIANHELPTQCNSLLARVRPVTTCGSLPNASAATTAGGTSAGGTVNSSGTNASCVGTVNPDAT